jgi:hypothetical protein
MKKLIAILACLFPLVAGAGNSTVMCDSNGIIAYPTNFFTINSVGTTSGIAVVQAQVTVLNGLTNGTYATAAQYSSVSGKVSVIEGYTNGYASTTALTAVSNIAVASATATNLSSISNRVVVLETYTAPYTNGTVYATNGASISGTVTATAFVGSGAGLTGVTATSTNVVSSITAGASNFTGGIVLSGTRVAPDGLNTVKVSNVEYICRQIVPTTATYEYIWEGPRAEAITISSIWSKVDQYDCTFTIVSQNKTNAWRSATSLVAGVIALPTGTTTTTNLTIAAGDVWGIYITDYDTRTYNMVLQYKISY